MSQSFKFGFEDDNVKKDDIPENEAPKDAGESVLEDAPGSGLLPTLHDLDEIVRLFQGFFARGMELISLA